jgi:hypothetical protein
MYHVIEPDSEDRLGGSDNFEACVNLARMLATEPVRLGQTWASEVRDDDGHVLATFARQQA